MHTPQTVHELSYAHSIAGEKVCIALSIFLLQKLVEYTLPRAKRDLQAALEGK